MNIRENLRTRCARLAMLAAWLFASVVTANAGAAELSLPPIFANEMILQRDKPVNVWGKSFAGDTITVTFGDATVKTTVEKEDWSVQLPAMPASAEGRTLTVAGKNGTKTFTDVLVGEVWLAGGQSNMSWHIRQEIDDKTYEMLQNYDFGGQIRVFQQNFSKDGVKTEGWSKTHPVTEQPKDLEWSVVGLHFAKYLHEHLKVPVAIVQAATGNLSIQSFMTEEVLAASGLPAHPNSGTKETHTTGFSYDRYLRDVIPFSARGALWVHGEANAGQHAIYDKLLQTLIADWRAQFGQDLTFLIAQLPSYSSFTDRLDYKGSLNWRYMREAVTRAVSNTPNTAEVVTVDTMFEWFNIHPTDKKPIGDRFGLAARALAYGEDVLYKSPSYKSHTVNGDTVTIEFNDAPNGLKVDGYYTQSEVNGFMLAGDDLKFRNATAEIVNGNQIQVRSPDVPSPVHIRYNFIQAPQSNLCSAEGLPVKPFRTDAFAGPEQPPGGDNQAFLPDPTPPVPAGQTQLAVVVSEDANVDTKTKGGADKTGDGVDLSIRANFISYLKFLVDALPAGAVVESVTLRMYDNQNQVQGNGSNSFDVFRVTEPWAEATVTGNTRPAHDTNQVFARHRQKGNYKNGRAADFPLDPAMFAGGNGEYSLALVHTGTSWRNHVSFFKSKDSVDDAVQKVAGRSIAPTLFINYTVPTASRQ
jgi:sialate O-acetylesterase